MSSLKSAFHSVSGTFLNQVISLAGIMILARLITPQEYGVYALAYAVFLIFQPFLDFGLTPVYIKLDSPNQRINSVFFYFNLLIGVIIALFMLASAPFISSFYDNADLKWLIPVQAFCVLLMSAGNQPVSQLYRARRFFSTESIKVLSNSLALAAAISLAVKGWGLLALAVRFMTQSGMRFILGMIYSKASYIRIRIMDLFQEKSILTFGSHITISRIISGYAGNLDKFIIGKIFGDASLGQYERALHIAEKPNTLRNALTTPAIAHIARQERLEFENSYRIMVSLIILVTGLPALFFWLYGDVLTVFILGNQWSEAGIYVRYLSFLGLAIVIRGLINIIQINELNTRLLMNYAIVHFITIYPLCLCFLFIYEITLSEFVMLFSIMNLVFWFASMVHTFYHTSGLNELTLKVPGYIIVLIGSFSLCGWLLRSYMGPQLAWPLLLESVLIGSITSIVTMLCLFISFPSISRTQFIFIQKRISKIF